MDSMMVWMVVEKERKKKLDNRYNVNTNIFVAVVGYDIIILTFVRMEYANDDDDDSIMLMKWMLLYRILMDFMFLWDKPWMCVSIYRL